MQLTEWFHKSRIGQSLGNELNQRTNWEWKSCCVLLPLVSWVLDHNPRGDWFLLNKSVKTWWIFNAIKLGPKKIGPFMPETFRFPKPLHFIWCKKRISHLSSNGGRLGKGALGGQKGPLAGSQLAARSPSVLRKAMDTKHNPTPLREENNVFVKNWKIGEGNMEKQKCGGKHTLVNITSLYLK